MTSPDRPLSQLARRCIAKLELHGHAELAEQVRAGATKPTAALIAAGLREPTPPRRARSGESTADEFVLHDDAGRQWLEIDETAADKLDLKEGDAVHIDAIIEVDEGPPEPVRHIGIAGTKQRIWLVSDLDFDRVVSAVLRRRRPV